MNKPTAQCLQCGSTPTIRAHLIPLAFSRDVIGDSKNFALTMGMTPRFQPVQAGKYDDGLLCRPCDNTLGNNENYARETFAQLREVTTEKLYKHVGVSPISGDRLIRFAAGIAWKFAATKPEYGRINIGPYCDLLRFAAFGGDLSPAIDMFMVRLRADRFEESFFRQPKPDRHYGINFVRMTMGGFILFLKIDQRPNPAVSLPEVWLKGRQEVVFPTLPMKLFEEGRFVSEIWRQDTKLARFLLRDLGG